ncbi:MAG: hypothetical protein KBT46_08130 [Ruminococcus sp.]|nr:hypothetical protein [Candidatus Copronaster equi]
MKNLLKKSLSIFLSGCICAGITIPALAKDVTDYKISNPYEDVAELLSDSSAHYKTNLHTHSTVSDATVDYADMIKGYYENGFDILGFADHGIIGKYWNENPAQLPLYLYQYVAGRKVTKLTDEEYKAITGGTYNFPEESGRIKGRGLQCVPTGIELNMVTMTKSHVNGYFCDFGQGDIGFENGHEYAVKNVDKAGGISVINHPGDWLGSAKHPEKARDIKNVRYFGDIFNKYKSCLGMEILNRVDSVTSSDRILWDSVLQYVIPRGERTVWGFGNSDAHKLTDIDTSYMDFILPEYSLDNVKKTMENGSFFTVGRRARKEMPDDFVGEGPLPRVTGIVVDEENDIITVTAENTDKIQWIANGKTISETIGNGKIISTIKLREHSQDITCYVRFQLIGAGGICFSQPFTCDDGNMARFIIEDDRTESQKFFEELLHILSSMRIYVVFQELYRKIF